MHGTERHSPRAESGPAARRFLLACLLFSVACAGEGPAGPVQPTSVASITVTPPSNAFTALGESATLSAVATDAGGRSLGGQSFTWTSSNTGVAMVDAGGTVTAVGNGSAEIRASSGGVTGAAAVVVAQVTTAILIEPDEIELVVADAAVLDADALDARGHPVAGATFIWTSSAPTVASVDPTGVVTGVTAGQATITARSQGISATALVRVVAGTMFMFASVSVDGHSCGIGAGETGYCWGSNSWGELGSDIGFLSRTPTTIRGGHRWASISPGVRLTCGLTTDGDAFCWGRDEAGRLGIGTSPAPDSCVVPPSSTGQPCARQPVAVAGGHRFTALSTGSRFACAIETNGAAWCWGLNDSGQLGTGASNGPEVCAGSVPCSTVPVPVAGGLAFASISAGLDHVCAVTQAGVAWCWGSNLGGTLGDGTGTPKTQPVPVAGTLVFASVTAGFNHTCGLTTTGAVYCWGVNQEGQLGVPNLSASTVPVPLSGGLSFASADTRCGVTLAGDAYCWGANRFGQLGVGTTTGPQLCVYACSRQPVAVTGGARFRAISSGRAAQVHSCGITMAGAVYCWGLNSAGALGDGSTTDRAEPVLVQTPS